MKLQNASIATKADLMELQKKHGITKNLATNTEKMQCKLQ